MKKIIYTLLALFTLAGCQQDEWTGNNQKREIRVTANLPVTRTLFTENGNVTHVSWEEGDVITIQTNDQGGFIYRAKETGQETEFYPVMRLLQASDGDSLYACYPNGCDENGLVHLQNWGQKYGSKCTDSDFIYAINEVKDGQVSFQFKHFYAFLKITIPTALIPDRGENGGLYIESTENISHLNGVFDLRKGELASTDGYKGVDYLISDDVQEEEITCYIAILPQSEGTIINIYHMAGEPGELKDCLLTKKVPTGGFKPGNVYTIRLNGNEMDERYQMEREALVALYNATDGDNWTNKDNWCSDKPLDEWSGISTKNGSVFEVWLYDNNLNGSIPSEIGNLLNLSYLSLGVNHLTGEIPAELTNLRKLSYLQLNDNELEGEFPDLTFMNTTISSRILIQNNKFEGKLPEFQDLENGSVFFANNNKFSGNIPESHIKYLQQPISETNPYGFVYDVTNNNLTGQLPDGIAKHENFHVHWFTILPQNTGYGFDRVDIPAHTNTVKCFDGSFINLGDAYRENEYTILFRWDPYCPISPSYLPKMESLRKKYEEKGLGIIGMTLAKYSETQMQPFTENMPETKVFWEMNTFHESWMENEYENNPYHLGTYFYLFRYDATPYFFVIDKTGNIIFFGSGAVSPGSIPQYHDNRDDIFKYVANLFGDEDFVPDVSYYTSSDYSKDGEVVTLQTASVGRGIDLVFMGDGFTDKDMEQGGKYEQKMTEAMEQYFDIEPYKTFRNRFNVYAVKVVSPNEEFAEGAVHGINENNNVCFEYAQKVPNIHTDRLHISVVYNSLNAGRSYTVMYSDGTFVGYMKEGVNPVLNHEVGGHGFAKLLDEYVEGGYENLTFPEDDKDILDSQWENWGWGANVDWRNDWTTVKWSRLLNDSRYANEGLGLYEGAYLYGYGAYRPTENSMMRYNDSPFNAPSREQIYKTIMQLSEGDGWTYNYEDFVEYDAINRNATTTRALQTLPSEAVRKEWQQRHRPPVFVKGTWRDAVKRKQRK